VNPTSSMEDDRRKRLAFGLIMFILAAAIRLVVIDRQGLWADEVFSLAMATGHSLEHPAFTAQPELGDYVEAPHALLATEYKRYLKHQDPPVGPSQVIRAVFLSDTSPPLYYLLLWLWTRIGGTCDAALRSFSVFWALACFPLLWSLAKESGGRPATWPVLLLFTVSPLSIYYSTEGRMYSLLWFLAAGLAWLTLKLNQRGPRPMLLTVWILVGAAGMLTHYFYVFIVLVCSVWLLIYPGKLSRVWLLVAGIGIAVLIGPWYLQIAESLSFWRVTKDWLLIPSVSSRAMAALKLPWTFISPSSRSWSSEPAFDFLAMVVFVLLALSAIRKLRWRLCSKRRQLIWMWLIMACAGPFVFDKIMGTYTTAVPRYAIMGMPAALLLVGLSLGRLHPKLRAGFLLVILIVWLPSAWTVTTNHVRGWQPYRELASVLDEQATDSDVVIVHSIPSGVLGIARYVQKPISMFSWVGQLKQRHVPDDIESLLARERIILIKIHTVGEPAPEEAWLRNHVRLADEMKMGNAEALFFVQQLPAYFSGEKTLSQ
jgi:uncharacterized membrane protein